MKYKFLLISSALVLAISGGLAHAQEGTAGGEVQTNTQVKTPKMVPPGEVRAIQEKKKEEVKAVKTESRTNIQNTKAEVKDIRTENQKAVAEAKARAEADGVVTPEERSSLEKLLKSANSSTTAARIDAKLMIKEERGNMREDIAEIRDAARTDVRAAIEERKMKIASSSDARKEEMKQKALERAGAFLERVIKRMSAAIDREEKLQERVTSRIAKIKAAGGTTTTAETSLSEAESKLKEAQTSLGEVSVSFANLTSLENPSEGAQEVAAAAKKVEDLIKESHAALVKSVSSLKGQKGADAKASVVIETNEAAVEGDAGANVDVVQ